MVHHAPTSRLQEQGRETLEEARLLLEAPTARDAAKAFITVSYTHLTLPTICSV